ncbi:MAG: hypothetical protein ACKOUR_13460 [Planctomycetota bacterium]
MSDVSRLGTIDQCPTCHSMVQLVPAPETEPGTEQREHMGRTTVLPPSRPPPTELDAMNNLLAGRALPKPGQRASAGRAAAPGAKAPAVKSAGSVAPAPGQSATTLEPKKTPRTAAQPPAGRAPTTTSSAGHKVGVTGAEPPVAIPDAGAIPWTEDAVSAATNPTNAPPPLVKRLFIPLVIVIAILAALLTSLLWPRGGDEEKTPAPKENSAPVVDPSIPAAQQPQNSSESQETNASDPPAPDSATEPAEKSSDPDTSRSPEKPAPAPRSESPDPAPRSPDPARSPDPDASPDEGSAARKPVEANTASKKDDAATGANRVLPGPPGLKPSEPGSTSSPGPEPVAGRFAKLIGGAVASAADTTPGPLTPRVAAPREKNVVTPDQPTPDQRTPASTESPLTNSTSSDGAAAEMQRPAPREVDVKARLADKVAGLTFERVPLIDLLQLVSDLTTIPISIDLDALALRGISPLTPTPVQLEKTTMEQGLDAILKSQQLGYRQLNGQLVIVPREQLMPRRESRTYDVSDLVGKEPELAQTLLRWIRTAIDPSGWQPDANPDELRLDGGQLVVEQTSAVHLQVMRLCDQWRVARKIRPKFPLPAPLVEVGVNLEQSQSLLDKPLTLTFQQPVRLAVLLERLGKSAGTKFLVDWQALAEAEWSPDMTVTLSVENRPLSETLAKLLGPRELTYGLVDASLVEITTPGALARRVEFRLHAVAGLAAAADDSARVKDVLQRVRTVLGLEDAAESTGGVPSVEWDALSRHLVVIASPTQQIDVARALRPESTTVAP